MWTTSGGLDRNDVTFTERKPNVFRRFDEVKSRKRQSFQRLPPGAVINLLHSSFLKIVEDFWPNIFCFACTDGINVLQGLFRKRGRVNPPHDYGDVSSPEFIRDLISPPHGKGSGGNRNQIDWFVEINGIHNFITQSDLVLSGVRPARYKIERGGTDARESFISRSFMSKDVGQMTFMRIFFSSILPENARPILPSNKEL